MHVDRNVMERLQDEIEILRLENARLKEQLGKEIPGSAAPSTISHSKLEAAWEDIQDNIHKLSLEPYIDDQIELSNVWEICENLIANLLRKRKHGNSAKESLRIL